MTNRELLENNGYEDVVVFENPSYEGALIGVSHDNRAIYDADKMAEYLIQEYGMEEDEAWDFLSYNTIRACDYEKDAPIVMYKLADMESVKHV